MGHKSNSQGSGLGGGLRWLPYSSATPRGIGGGLCQGHFRQACTGAATLLSRRMETSRAALRERALTC